MSQQISNKQMLFSDKQGQGPKAQLSPSRVLVLGKRRQISAGGSGRARSLSGVVQADLTDGDPGRLRCSYFREIGRCRGSLLPQAWAEARGGLVGGGALEPYREDPSLLPGPQLTH